MTLVNSFEPDDWRPLPLELQEWVNLIVSIVEAGEMGKAEQTKFDDLKGGDQFFDAHPDLGWVHFTKIAQGWASAFRQTVSGRQHNDFAEFEPDYKVVKSGHLKDF